MSPAPCDSYQEAEKYFRQGLPRIEPGVDEDQIRQLVRYCLELRKWNKKVNLVARQTALIDLVDKHFLDSLILAPVLRKYDLFSGPLLDVGSGAGFPGLPLKIAFPLLPVYLLEPRHRRAAFLKHVIRMLGLKHIDVLVQRTEDTGGSVDKNLQVITGRAVADVAEFLNMVGHLASAETVVICMQGAEGGSGWKKSMQSGDFTCLAVEQAKLPFSGTERFLLLFQRIR